MDKWKNNLVIPDGNQLTLSTPQYVRTQFGSNARPYISHIT